MGIHCDSCGVVLSEADNQPCGTMIEVAKFDPLDRMVQGKAGGPVILRQGEKHPLHDPASRAYMCPLCHSRMATSVPALLELSKRDNAAWVRVCDFIDETLTRVQDPATVAPDPADEKVEERPPLESIRNVLRVNHEGCVRDCLALKKFTYYSILDEFRPTLKRLEFVAEYRIDGEEVRALAMEMDIELPRWLIDKVQSDEQTDAGTPAPEEGSHADFTGEDKGQRIIESIEKRGRGWRFGIYKDKAIITRNDGLWCYVHEAVAASGGSVVTTDVRKS